MCNAGIPPVNSFRHGSFFQGLIYHDPMQSLSVSLAASLLLKVIFDCNCCLLLLAIEKI